uniref:PsbP-like protein 1, chloroplastic isoform X2 n=1 Tax=Elaeis guineensis var. tenera TaxID=51953 RepID=A0A6I9R5B0_ELAGV|nr:psbP-like protein 1, chloroplastic isoform X2 [Elaeis guineensis]
MALLQHSPALHRALFLNSSSSSTAFHQGPAFFPGHLHRSRVTLQVRAEDSPIPPQDCIVERSGRRHALALGAISTCISLTYANSASSEVKKGFQSVLDKKDGYSFLYPFGWQEVVIEGQDKVLKDVIEPLESISVNMVPTSKQDVRDFGSPQEVADTLIKKVLAPPSQKIKLVEAAECSRPNFHPLDSSFLTKSFLCMMLMGELITPLSSLLRLRTSLDMLLVQFPSGMVNFTP